MSQLLRSAIREILSEAGRSFGSDMTEAHISATNSFISEHKDTISTAMGWDTTIGPAVGSIDNFSNFVEMFKLAAAKDLERPGELPLTTFTLILIFDDADPGGMATAFAGFFNSLVGSVRGFGDYTGMYESRRKRRILKEGLGSRLVISLLGKTVDESISKAFTELADEAMEAELGSILRRLAKENFDNDIKKAIQAMDLATARSGGVAGTLAGSTFTDARVAVIDELKKAITVKLSPELATALFGDAKKTAVSLFDLERQYVIRDGGGLLTAADKKFETQILQPFERRAFDTLLDPANLEKDVLRYTQGSNPVTKALTEPGRQAAKRGLPRLGKALSMGGESVDPVTFFSSPAANQIATKLKYAAARSAAPAAGAAAYATGYYSPGLFSEPTSEFDIGGYEDKTGEGAELSDVVDMMEQAGVQSAAGRLVKKLKIYDMTYLAATNRRLKSSAETVKSKISGQLNQIAKSSSNDNLTGTLTAIKDLPSVSA